jgi:hypothetical protein
MQHGVKIFLCLPAFLTMGCAAVNDVTKAEYTAVQAKPALSCQFSADDNAWVNRAISAWHDVNRTISQVADIGVFDVIFFDAQCQRMSSDALLTPNHVTWTSELHDGTVQFPNGDEMPPIVNSFTMSTAEGYVSTKCLAQWRCDQPHWVRDVHGAGDAARSYARSSITHLWQAN